MGNYEEKWSQKRQDTRHFEEDKAKAFRCGHCRAMVVVNPYIGTSNRNHCNMCLWSKHVDIQKGDRKSDCGGGMQPIGLTFKQEGQGRIGELMLIHVCAVCKKISINRLAADDSESVAYSVFEDSLLLGSEMKQEIENEAIYLARRHDTLEIRRQFGG